jgi:hypothetical protein
MFYEDLFEIFQLFCGPSLLRCSYGLYWLGTFIVDVFIPSCIYEKMEEYGEPLEGNFLMVSFKAVFLPCM